MRAAQQAGPTCGHSLRSGLPTPISPLGPQGSRCCVSGPLQTGPPGSGESQQGRAEPGRLGLVFRGQGSRDAAQGSH